MDITLIATIGAITTIIQAIGTVVVVRIQKTQIEGLQANVASQTAVINAIKTQAEGQAAITTRLEAIVDRTERHATTVLTNHEKLIKLVEDRANREKEELETRAEREKQEMNELLEDARDQLSTREKTIQDAEVKPELASLLTSLSQESFATKEMLTGLKNELAKLVSLYSGAIPPIQSIESIQREGQIINADSFPLLTAEDKKHISNAVMRAHFQRYNSSDAIAINKVIMGMQTYFAETARELNSALYKEVVQYANTLNLGPFVYAA